MAAIPGVRFDITGASGSQGLLSPKDSWRAYVFPRGGYASQSSTGTQVTFDSAAIASRYAVNNWVQAGLLTGNIRQVMGVGGNSITLNSALTVATNDRVFLIGNTQPTVNGGSATYTTPDTLIRQRDDDSATLYTNSMVTSDTNGSAQWFASAGVYDVLVQDGNGANQGAIYDLPCGISADYPVTFGLTVTMNGNVTFNGIIGVTGIATFGSTIVIVGTSGNYTHRGTAHFGNTVTMDTNLGVTGSIVTPRLGQLSNSSTGGAIRFIDGVIFPLTVAGVQAALDEVETAGGGTVIIPSAAGVSISNTSVKIGNRVKLQGTGDHTQTGTFVATPTANVSAMVENKTQDGSQQYAYISNIYVEGNRDSGAVVTRGINFKQIYLGSVIEDVLSRKCSGNNIVIDGGIAAPHQQGGPIVARNCVTTHGGDDNFLVTGECNQIRLENIASESVDAGKAQIRINGYTNTVASAGHVLRGIYFEGIPAADGLVLDSCCNVSLDGLMQNSANANNAVKILGRSVTGSDGAFAAGGHVLRNIGANIVTIIDDRVAGVSVSNANGRFVHEYVSPVQSSTLDNAQTVGVQTARVSSVASGFSISVAACNANFFEVTGTSRVQTIVGDSSFAGKYVTFMFSNASPQGFSTGGNIRLAGGVVWTPAQWDCLTLAYYGTTWFEMSPR